MPEDKYFREYDVANFLKILIGSSSYELSQAKASLIRNPCFRYAHRLVRLILFCRNEANVRKDDLYLLWAMTKEDDIILLYND